MGPVSMLATRRVPALRGRRRTHRGERGAVAVLASFMILLLVTVASFVVDIGLQRTVRRDMQALADVVAFDMSRQLDGRRASVILASSSWTTALSQSLARNCAVDAVSSCGSARTLGDTPIVNAEVGVVSDAGVFTTYTGADIPTAVRVTAQGNVAFSIPVVSDEGGATRSAIATQRRQACIKLGSYAATVQSGNSALLSSILGQINSALGIGGSGGLTAVGYEGLANANVSAGELATALGLASPSDLSTANVSYSQLLGATASVLSQNGQSQAAGYVGAIRTNLGTMGGANVPVGQLANIASGSSSALAANLNVLDLVAGGATLINGSNALSVPGLSTSALGLANGTSSLSLIEGARTKCGFRGSTVVDTSQANLNVSANLTASSPTALAGLVSLSVASPPNRPTTIAVQLAKAQGSLDDVSCPGTTSSGTSTSFGATIGVTSGVSSATLTIPVRASGRVNVLGVGLVNFTADVTLTVTNNSATNTNTVTVEIPPRSFDTAYSSGTGQLSLNAASTSTSSATFAASLLLSGLSFNLSLATRQTILDNIVANVANPLVNTLNNTALIPLGNLLGVGLGGADVFLLGPRLVCDSPALRG